MSTSVMFKPNGTDQLALDAQEFSRLQVKQAVTVCTSSPYMSLHVRRMIGMHGKITFLMRAISLGFGPLCTKP